VARGRFDFCGALVGVALWWMFSFVVLGFVAFGGVVALHLQATHLQALGRPS
jgi:hypothetical protein